MAESTALSPVRGKGPRRKRGRQTALLLGAALLIGEFACVAEDGDGCDGAAGEAFVDVVGVIGSAIPFVQAVMFLVVEVGDGIVGPIRQNMPFRSGRPKRLGRGRFLPLAKDMVTAARHPAWGPVIPHGETGVKPPSAPTDAATGR